ncbi:MAG TPA: hypothetical protein PKH24_20765 [Sedimentisphaerales bacterium]|nr:hypothetical protein [Sedimentisphaerales bacterium]HNU31521.1 hypothetical protein [Sedimentisphaerales bacterium]
MKAKQSKLLVVDASVARSAGETEHPVSACCRESLLAILNICHRIVLTEAIRQEWHRHASRFTRKWLVSMYAKKKVPPCNDAPLNRVDNACEVLSPGEQEELRKDLCLIEAACAADGIIITRDDAIVQIWQKCHSRLGLSKPIRWINPVPDGVSAMEQL